MKLYNEYLILQRKMKEMYMKRYFVIGGAGFIGSHLVKKIVNEKDVFVTVYDNFSSGRMWHLNDIVDSCIRIEKGDIKDKEKITHAMKGHDVIYHFASNPDISKAVTDPEIDFWDGTYLTNNVLEAMRVNKVKKLLYASGSGVYGDTGTMETDENYSPMRPISTYGASKLACEALICSYCHMFDMNAAAFRFANVVGPRQTHGVGYDFVNRLLDNSHELTILGDGTQSKSYIHVTDVLNAMRIVESKKLEGFDSFNVATKDYITVTGIANTVVKIMNLNNVQYKYTGGDRGWKGDVPIVRLNSKKMRSLGWTNRYTSHEAIYDSVKSILEDAKAGRFTKKYKQEEIR